MKIKFVFLLLICSILIVLSSCIGLGVTRDEEIDTYLNYAGPVMPLKGSGDTDGITAKRSVYFDFNSFDIKENRKTMITDSYILINDTAEDKTIDVSYPFVSSIKDSGILIPALTINGESPETKLLVGDYTGSFGSSGDENRTYNLIYINSWEKYKTLLENDQYFQNAKSSKEFADQCATVYTFSDISWPEGYSKPDITIEFDLPPGSRIITCGMRGASFEEGNPHHGYIFDGVPELENKIIVLGEPPVEYSLHGYDNVHYNKENIDVTAKVNIETIQFSKVIQQRIMKYMETVHNPETISELITEELAFNAVASMFKYTALGEQPVERYNGIQLDFLIKECFKLGRILYLTTQVIIPAGQSVELQSRFVKNASYDFPGVELKKNKGVSSFDMMLNLGSNFKFSEQKAALQLASEYEIIRQSFGFDLEHGITEVILDMTQERYYLDVKEKALPSGDNSQ